MESNVVLERIKSRKFIKMIKIYITLKHFHQVGRRIDFSLKRTQNKKETDRVSTLNFTLAVNRNKTEH